MTPVSIIIPAHNEEQTLPRLLNGLLRDADRGEFDVCVVCNGCTDRTAEVAGEFGPDVRVLESEVASKSAALNVGDAAARHFPRCYIDADVEVSTETVRRVAELLSTDETALAAAPRLSADLSKSSKLVRAFYRVWLSLPYIKDGFVGSGFYAMSTRGRERFDTFPPITADDAFVRLQFDSSERVTLRDCAFVIRPPRDLRRLVKIKTRAHFGNLELARRFPELLAKENARHSTGLLASKAEAGLTDVAVYALVRVVSRLGARWRLLRGRYDVWERDDSSRAPIATGQ